MITDTIKGYLYGAVGILLAGSLIGNVVQYQLVGSANERATEAEKDRDAAQNAAGLCSDSISELHKNADAAAALAKDKIDAAKKAETRSAARAQKLLATPASVPGDDCKSAIQRANAWLKGEQ